MKRQEEFNQIKQIIKERYKDASCGLFNTLNCVGDTLGTIFNGKYFTLNICLNYEYFEVFGTTDKEFTELEKLYDSLGE